MLRTHEVTAVFDVGASTGGFASHLFDAGFDGRVISFEPLTRSHGELLRAARGNTRWIVAPPVAIGSQQGTGAINISAHVGSSSLLPMLSAHLAVVPSSGFIGKEIVQVTTLDDAASNFLAGDEVVFIKIDVQGFESEVLKGARRTLARAAGVHIELSFVPLYEGQSLFRDTWDHLSSLGFELWAFSPAFTDSTTGRMLQIDGVFFRDVRAA
ncbi:MAG TPA: FkbM family methyltransferase [Terriglobales bacterium]|nr:FkbM family methyltransferase [Terriglobales bacterium]